MSNAFLTAVRQHDTYTENGAVSHSTTGDALLDYFAKAGTFRGRDLEAVYADVSRIWAESPKIALQVIFYLRMITRKTHGLAGGQTETVQKGQGIRDEYRKAIGWIAKFHPDIMAQNLWLMPIVGCWKDLWHADLIDVLDREQVYALIAAGAADKYNRELLAKYLPKIRSKRNTHNDRHRQLNAFARGLCRHLRQSEKKYRQFKASGESHGFQRAMSRGLWDKLDFARIPGKALFQLVNSKGRDDKKTVLERHGLEARYLAWLETQPVAKFTGYPYELMGAVEPGLSVAQKFTIDKQFAGLLKLASEDGAIEGNVWCAMDTSGSMGQAVTTDVTAYDICVSLGIYFSALNEGVFKDHVIMFDAVSRHLKLAGTFSDKVSQIRQTTTAWGNTNFQSVIDEIVRIRTTRPEIPTEDFPETILVVSDMQFDPSRDPAQRFYHRESPIDPARSQTNYETAMAKLAAVGLPNVRIIWWWVTGRSADFPSTIADEGVTMIGGFDGAVVSLLLGGEQTIRDESGKVRQLNAHENMLKTLNQELLLQVKVT